MVNGLVLAFASFHADGRLGRKLWDAAAMELATGGIRVARPGDDVDPVESTYTVAVSAGTQLAGLPPLHDLAPSLATPITLEREVRQSVPLLRSGRLNRVSRLVLAGLGTSTDEPGWRDLLLGALALGDHRDAVLGPWREAVERVGEIAIELECAPLIEHADQLATRLSVFEESPGGLVQAGTSLVPLDAFGRMEPTEVDELEHVLDMGRRFLLSDPDLAETWEVHRRGMAGHDLVVAPFPAGLVIEVLACQNVGADTQIERYVGRLASQGFSYYDLPEFAWVETDTVGTLLRLLPDVPERFHEQIHALVEATLSLIERTGEVPVWLTGDREEVARSGIVLLGEGCGTIQARLLSALLESGKRGPVLAAARRLLGRFVEYGGGITVNYPPLFLAGAVRELVGRLGSTVSESLRARVEDRLRLLLEAARAHPLGLQDAALLVKACLETRDAHLVDEALVRGIVDAQGFDGGWPAEPLFFAPNRGGRPTWYASRTVTTALCFDALSVLRRV